MANTYTKIHLHFVFAPKFQASLIHQNWENELYKYITGIAQNNNNKMIAINGMPDHVHMLIGFRPTQSISDFMRVVKNNSSKWINEKKFNNSRFEWQSGYGAFSYSKSQLDDVVQYTMNQKVHHQKLSFLDEYKLFLKKFEVEFEEKFIFKLPE